VIKKLPLLLLLSVWGNFPADAQVYNVYYGQLHSHTNDSDGSGTPAEAYEFARDNAGLDFFSLADHCSYPYGANESLTVTKYQIQQSIANRYNDDGNFVTFWGFEWTSFDKSSYSPSTLLGKGHIAIINSPDYCEAIDESTNDLNELVDWMSTRDCIGFFNHPGRSNLTFDHFIFNHSEKIVGMELWNRSVDFYDNGSWYHSALEKGWYIGAAGSQDNHSKQWGTVNEWRMAVLAPELTRASLYEAMKKRRFYSSRDENLVLSFTCNDAEMGSKIIGGDLNVQINASDGNGESFSKIDLLKNGSVIQTWTPNSTNPSLSTTTSGIDGDYFYVMVYQEGSEWTAISSPIFIDSSVLDTDPPTPDPMTFSSAPAAAGTTSIAMTASLATDAENSVEYYFTCTAGGGNDRGWQADRSYTDTGLNPDTQYTYTVKARDTSANHNKTTASDPSSATTNPDIVPPIPDPLTWELAPEAGTFTLGAITVSSYVYDGISVGTGNDDGTQPSDLFTNFLDPGNVELTDGVIPSTVGYNQAPWVAFRDDDKDLGAPHPQVTFDFGSSYDVSSIIITFLHYNTTITPPEEVRISVSSDNSTWTTPVSFTGFGGTTPPEIGTTTLDVSALDTARYYRLDFRQSSQWTVIGEVEFTGKGLPLETDTSVTMVATIAVDPSDVEYYFECIAGSGYDSGWQDSIIYTDTGLSPCTLYAYKVQARDKSTARNATEWSSIESATTDSDNPGDVTGDCAVDWADLRIIVQDWLQSESMADIYPSPDGDGIVNFLDFSALTLHWLEGVMP